MKKLLTLCMLLTIAFTCQAQNGKPTKEETLQFIIDYYQNNRMSTGVSGFTDTDNQKNFYSEQVENIDMQFDGKLNKISIYLESIYNSKVYTNSGKLDQTNFKKEKYVIDLSKIESINQSNILMRKEDDVYEITLDFKATQGYKIEHFQIDNYESLESLVLPSTPEMKNIISIPINFYKTDKNFDHSSHNKKILQAFNHLRKLCGAPEPISFD
ncbi:MAG: hypothetical protein ACOH1N_08120 [Lutibacter sp.]